MNIIITNVGRRGYLVDYIKNTETFQGKVFVSDCDKTASGLYGNNDGFFILSKPVDNEKEYIERLCDLCISKDIDIVLPVIDPEIEILSRNKAYFLQKGIHVIVSSERVLEICYSKLCMNSFLKEIGIDYPITYSEKDAFLEDVSEGKMSFPVIIKPIYGSGSVDTYVVSNADELISLFKDGMIIQEYMKGAVEYGTDTFNTLDGVPVRVVIKQKISMRSGETDKSITKYSPKIRDMLIHLGKELGHIGNLDTDILFYNGKYYVIDMNPRFGGGYPATHAAGVNMMELILRMVEGETITPEFDNYTENLLVMKTIGINTTIMNG